MSYAYYLRPDRLLTLQVGDDGVITPAAVTGDVDSAHQAIWLCDGRGHFPFRAPAGENMAVSIAGFTQSCGLAVLHSHTLDAAVPLEITGDATVTLSDRGGDRPNGIPWNRWVAFDPVSAANLIVTAEYNSRDIVIGELLVGERFTIDPPQPGIQNDLPTFALPLNAEFAAGNAYDKGMAGGRLLKYAQAYEKTEIEAVADGLIAWFEACRNGTLPTAFVPTSLGDDIVVGTLMGLGFEDYQQWAIVTLTFQEYTRQRWSLVGSAT